MRRRGAPPAVLGAIVLGLGTLTASAESRPMAAHPAKGAPVTVKKWYVARVQRARVQIRHGQWHECGSYEPSRLTTHFSCSIANSRFRTIHASITGSLEVPKGTLSASIGYDAGESVTYTNTYSVDVPPHHYGTVMWRATYKNRKRVEQDQRKWGHGHFFGPVLDRRWVTTEEVGGPNFRVRDHKQR